MFENETLRKALFVVIAAALVGLGVYVTAFSDNEEKQSKSAPTSVVTVAPTAAGTTAIPATPEATAPPVKVDQPLTDAEINAAAAVAQRFLLAYGSFDYRVSEVDQLSSMSFLTDSDAQFDVTTLVPRGAGRDTMVAAKVMKSAQVRFDDTTFTTGDSVSFLVTLTTVTTGGANAGEKDTTLTISMTGSGDAWTVLALDQGDEFGEA